MASSSPDNLSSASLTSSKGELPGPIAALPADHPARKQWEKEYRQQADGSWTKADNAAGPSKKSRRKKREKMISQLATILFLAAIILVGTQIYRTALNEKRQIILRIIKQKGFEKDDPTVHTLYVAASMTSWLPELDRLLEILRGLPVKTTESFPENPEKGSYIEYIQRYDLPFNEGEALEWQARSLRRPAEPASKP